MFPSKEERAAKRAKRDQARVAVLERIGTKFAEAIEAADAGDVLAEELAIQEGSVIAAKADTLTWHATPKWEQRLNELTEGGEVRRAQMIGFASQTYIWADRIVSIDEMAEGDLAAGIHAVDSTTRAEVMTEGQLRTTKRPTLTRMAAGSVLPGTALIPGLAFQKKETIDDRRLFLTIEQANWGKIIELDPEKVDHVEMREVAMRLNQAANQSAPDRQSASGVAQDAGGDADLGSPAGPDVTSQLEKLGQLRDAGVLSDDEFHEGKRKLLDAM
jgi:hypothetical protein